MERGRVDRGVSVLIRRRDRDIKGRVHDTKGTYPIMIRGRSHVDKGAFPC